MHWFFYFFFLYKTIIFTEAELEMEGGWEGEVMFLGQGCVMSFCISRIQVVHSMFFSLSILKIFQPPAKEVVTHFVYCPNYLPHVVFACKVTLLKL